MSAGLRLAGSPEAEEEKSAESAEDGKARSAGDT
jgi:hypothetical protein